jgi:hypothetical protein
VTGAVYLDMLEEFLTPILQEKVPKYRLFQKGGTPLLVTWRSETVHGNGRIHFVIIKPARCTNFSNLFWNFVKMPFVFKCQKDMEA